MNQVARIGKTTGLGTAAVGGGTKNLLAGAAVALALLGAGSSAQAAVITWNLHGVAFDDGGSASGFFDYDTVLGTVENFHITTTAGQRLPGFSYDTSTSVFYGAGFFAANDLLWMVNNGSRYIVLGFMGSLDTPGTVALTKGGPLGASWECKNCAQQRFLRGGEVTTNGVPEPASWALMLTGFLGMGAALRRGRRHQTALAA